MFQETVTELLNLNSLKNIKPHMSDQIEQKILALYALGNNYAQISEHIEDFYGVHFSKTTISAVTDQS